MYSKKLIAPTLAETNHFLKKLITILSQTGFRWKLLLDISHAYYTSISGSPTSFSVQLRSLAVILSTSYG